MLRQVSSAIDVQPPVVPEDVSVVHQTPEVSLEAYSFPVLDTAMGPGRPEGRSRSGPVAPSVAALPALVRSCTLELVENTRSF